MNLQGKRSSGHGKILNYITHICIFYSFMQHIQDEHGFHFFLSVKALKTI